MLFETYVQHTPQVKIKTTAGVLSRSSIKSEFIPEGQRSGRRRWRLVTLL